MNADGVRNADLLTWITSEVRTCTSQIPAFRKEKSKRAFYDIGNKYIHQEFGDFLSPA